jgi:hypothetical protein
MPSTTTNTTPGIEYFASALDFDGGVIARPLQKMRNGNLGKPRLRTEISNNDWSILEQLQERFKGSIRPRGGRRCRSWVLEDTPNQLAFLRAIRPFLVVKAEIVELAIAFLEINVGHGGENKEAQQHRYDLWEHIRSMQRRNS